MKSRQDDFLGRIAIGGVITLIIAFMVATSGSNLTWLFFSLFIILLISFFVVLFADITDYPENIEKRNQSWKQTNEKIKKEELEYENQKLEYINLYGRISKKIKYTTFTSNSFAREIIFIFETSSKIIIHNKVFNFNDIIGYELKDDEQIIYQSIVSTSKSSTSTGSMLGRAVVGGILLGGVGAVIGGATAKKNTTTTNSPQKEIITHNYKLHIVINSLSEPQIILNLGKNSDASSELIAVLSVILERNKEQNDHSNSSDQAVIKPLEKPKEIDPIFSEVFSIAPKNLDVITFRNGDPINESKSQSQWEKAKEKRLPSWKYHKFNLEESEKFGKLYNWYAVNDPRGLAPEGWRIPDMDELNLLLDELGGEDLAGKTIKCTNFLNDKNGDSEIDLMYFKLGETLFGSISWWTSTKFDMDRAVSFGLIDDKNELIINNNFFSIMLPVRCIKDM